VCACILAEETFCIKGRKWEPGECGGGASRPLYGQREREELLFPINEIELTFSQNNIQHGGILVFFVFFWHMMVLYMCKRH
jgi:hypothetical protein